MQENFGFTCTAPNDIATKKDIPASTLNGLIIDLVREKPGKMIKLYDLEQLGQEMPFEINDTLIIN